MLVDADDLAQVEVNQGQKVKWVCVGIVVRAVTQEKKARTQFFLAGNMLTARPAHTEGLQVLPKPAESSAGPQTWLQTDPIPRPHLIRRFTPCAV